MKKPIARSMNNFDNNFCDWLGSSLIKAILNPLGKALYLYMGKRKINYSTLNKNDNDMQLVCLVKSSHPRIRAVGQENPEWCCPLKPCCTLNLVSLLLSFA